MKIHRPVRISTLLCLPLLLASSPASTEVSETLTYSKYIARHEPGMSLSETLSDASSIRHRGKTYFGYTSWNVQWGYDFRQAPNGRCQITRSDITLTAGITLPELDSSDEETRLAFSKYVEALHRHELGHYEIAQALVRKIEKAIESMPAMLSCAQLERETDAAASDLLEQAKQEELQYDESTQYGRTQGAWLEQ